MAFITPLAVGQKALNGLLSHKWRTLVWVLLFPLAACKQGDPSQETVAPPPPSLTVVAADVITLGEQTVATGPLITGSLQAKKQADLRAEISAVVLEIIKDNGDKVQKGDILIRLDDTAIRQALRSSEASERALQQTLQQSQKQLQRLKTLAEKGSVSAQSLEEAELRHQSAQSELAAAQARVAQDTQQLARTQIRAPFNGVVADKAVSTGDTLQVGKALIKVIEPSSIRFIGFVGAEQADLIKPGLAVTFRVNGRANPQYQGVVELTNPVVDAQTRQVGVQVALEKGTLLTAGLFAEGRVQSSSVTALALPESSVITQGDAHYVWQIQNNQLHKQEVQLGQRDIQSGQFVVLKGLAQGDTLLLRPVGHLVEGAGVTRVATPHVKKEH